MKNAFQLFKDYQNNNSLGMLISGLQSLEHEIQSIPLLIRFDNSHILYTINDLEIDLTKKNTSNYKFLIEQIESSIENESILIF